MSVSGPSDEDLAEYERERGLAAERTELAWGRSALALMSCGVGVVKGLPGVAGRPGHPAVGALLLALGAVVWASGVPLARARANAGRTGQRRPARSHELAPIAIGTAAVGLAALMVEIFLPI